MTTLKSALDEYRTKRTALEQRIRSLIDAESTAFYNETGVQVAAVSVEFLKSYMPGVPVEYVLGSVSVETALD